MTTTATTHTRPASEDLMSEKDAAAYLGLSPRTLQRYRISGGGPAYRRLGLRRICFLRSDLLAWTEAGRFASTSAEDAARAA